MKFLTSLLLLVATTCFGAVPDYKAFRGTGGITITSNPPIGTIVIDGSGISSPTGGVSAATVTNIVNSKLDSSTNALGYGITNFLQNKIIYVDPIVGKDATASRGDATKPYFTITNAVANSLAGDTVLLRNGIHNITNSIMLPVGVSLRGSSRFETMLVNKVGIASGPAVVPGSYSVISDLMITNAGTGGGGACVGVREDAAGIGFTNAIVENCELYGDADIAIIFTDFPLSIVFRGCTWKCKWDGLIVDANEDNVSAGLNVTWEACNFLYDGLGSGSGTMTFAGVPRGIYNVIGCKFKIKSSGVADFVAANSRAGGSADQFNFTGCSFESDTNIIWTTFPIAKRARFVACTVNGSSLNELYVTNVAAMASGRFTNDYVGNGLPTPLLDNVVIISALDASSTVKRTNLLFDATAFPGREITIADASKTASGSNIWIATVSSQTINGGPIVTNITTDNGSIMLVSDGANFRIKAGTAIASGSGVGLTTNANQFLGVPLSIKDGVLLSNAVAHSTLVPSGDNSVQLGTDPLRWSAGYFYNVDAVRIKISGVTALRPAFINGSGDITNASGTPDGTKFMRDDGVLAVPAGGGDVSTAQLNTASNVLYVASSNNVRVAAGVNSTVVAAGSGGVATYTVGSGITISTNSGALNVVTQIIARSGVVVSNDAAGTASFHVTAGGVGEVTTVQLNAASNEVVRLGSNNVRVAAGANIAVTPSGSGGVQTFTVASILALTNLTDVVATNVATGDVLTWLSGMGKWTNVTPFYQYNIYPTVTNIFVGTNAEQSVAINTNASFKLVFTGTPQNGETINLSVSNYGASVIYATNTFYNTQVGSNDTIWAIPALSERKVTFVSMTNHTLGTARWELKHSLQKEAELAAGSGTTLSTNADGSIISINLSTAPSVASLTITNNTTYLYSTSDFVATNSTANSNLTVAFGPSGTGTREIYLTNNISLTNYTGMAAGQNSSIKWRVIPTGMNRTVVWPASASSSFGMRLDTNAGSILWTTFTNGSQYMVSWYSWNTNLLVTVAAFSSP